MIKVNLLRDHAVRKRKKLGNLNISRAWLIFLASVVIVIGASGIFTLYINRQIDTGEKKRAELKREEDRLKVLQKEIEKFERLKQLRQSRIDVIEKLKDNQAGPVLLLNTIIESIPKDGVLWLNSLSQKADLIKIVGQTQQPEIIPDFMNNLTVSKIFKTVDLDYIDSQKDASKFSLTCVSIKKSQAE
jgi:Tfp pilus assembly protein PilN